MNDKKDITKCLLTRREFLISSGLLSLGVGELLSYESFKKSKSKSRPNILLIISDQLSHKAVGALGNKYVQTPNIDSIAEKGVCFTNAYCTYPLCQPVRASFWTGRLPHETGVLSNGRNFPVPTIPESMPTLGSIFAGAGYETVNFGKKHDAGALRGFLCEDETKSLPVESEKARPVNYDTLRDRYTTVKVVEYLKNKHEKPFFAVASLNNPHNICGWVGENQGPHQDIPIQGELPPLPKNFEIDDLANRPLPVQYLCCSHLRLAQAGKWNKTNYQHYLSAYYHYIDRVDKEIGLILDALYSSPAGKNTLVVLIADHGDGMGAHRMVTKQVSFYEEITRVPFMFAGPGIKQKGVKLNQPLVSLLDLLPTLCDYAELPIPSGLHGLSLLPMLEGKANKTRHDYVVSEWHTEYGYIITPGRMLRTERYKYTKYIEGDGEELYDLENDPGETHNLISNPVYSKVLKEHRELLREHLKKTNDNFFSLDFKADKRWRSHKLGYQYHEGPVASMTD